MTDIEKIKEYLVIDLIKKMEKKRIYNQNHKKKYKEKKRLLIEQIKKERQENSLIFNEI